MFLTEFNEDDVLNINLNQITSVNDVLVNIHLFIFRKKKKRRIFSNKY